MTEINFPSFFRHFSVIFSLYFEFAAPIFADKTIRMKKAAFKLVAVFVMILSLSTLSLNAEPTNKSHTVTLQKRPKQPKEHNQNLDRDGHRKPTAPVIVFFTTSDGIQSPYFEVADIISYSVLDDMGQTIFYTEDVTAFLNYIETCQSTIWIQLEFDDYYIEGWF